MSMTQSYIELDAAILAIDSTAHDCRLKISELRRKMDEACDHGTITITQWRELLDRVAKLQARCVGHNR